MIFIVEKCINIDDEFGRMVGELGMLIGFWSFWSGVGIDIGMMENSWIGKMFIIVFGILELGLNSGWIMDKSGIDFQLLGWVQDKSGIQILEL